MRYSVLLFCAFTVTAHANENMDQQRLAIIKSEQESTAAALAFEARNGNRQKAEQLQKDLELLNKELNRLSNPTKTQKAVAIREVKTRSEPVEVRRKQTESLTYESWDIFNDFGK